MGRDAEKGRFSARSRAMPSRCWSSASSCATSLLLCTCSCSWCASPRPRLIPPPPPPPLPPELMRVSSLVRVETMVEMESAWRRMVVGSRSSAKKVG